MATKNAGLVHLSQGISETSDWSSGKDDCKCLLELELQSKASLQMKNKFIVTLEVNIRTEEMIFLTACVHSFIREKPNAKAYVIQPSTNKSYQH